MADLIDAVGNAKVPLVRENRYADLWSVAIEVPMSAGYRHCWPTGDYAGPDQKSLLDRVSEVDGQEGRPPDVADGSEADPQRGLGVPDGGEGVSIGVSRNS